MNAKRRRVKAYVDALSELLISKVISRKRAVQLIKESLESAGVEPFRGASKPEDIYEKELISLYIIGTHGLGISNDFNNVFEKIFYDEKRFEMIINAITSEQSTDQVRETIKMLFGELDESTVAKILRFAVTLYYLDFQPYEFVIKVLKRMREVLPEHFDTIRRFTKFFVALKLGEEVYNGTIKTKVKKEIRKQAISLETGIPKSTPSDEYAAKVIRVLYEVPENILSSIFSKSERNEVNNAEEN